MKRRHVLQATSLVFATAAPVRAQPVVLAITYAPTAETWRGIWRDSDGGVAASRDLSCLCRDHTDGSENVIDTKLWDVLVAMAQYTGRSEWLILSGYRSPRTNAAVGGARRSFHSMGRAIDIRVPPGEIDAVAAAATRAGAGGVGIYRSRSFVHIDTRETPYMWG